MNDALSFAKKLDKRSAQPNHLSETSDGCWCMCTHVNECHFSAMNDISAFQIYILEKSASKNLLFMNFGHNFWRVGQTQWNYILSVLHCGIYCMGEWIWPRVCWKQWERESASNKEIDLHAHRHARTLTHSFRSYQTIAYVPKLGRLMRNFQIKARILNGKVDRC